MILNDAAELLFADIENRISLKYGAVWSSA
jgi:hypothetical protein